MFPLIDGEDAPEGTRFVIGCYNALVLSVLLFWLPLAIWIFS